jgi:16S rRNA (adenine1518-N6/adenine1519-N6)-dimethyltransferase
MNVKAKKKFGQNFLKDESIKQKIIQAMPNDNLKVVEIGPGLGDLTKKLLEKEKSITAFEIDLELCEILQNSFKSEIESRQLELVCDDVLNRWSDDSLIEEEYHLIANLPYYVATNIILKALEDKKCKTILVMIQKEVAQKFSAKAGEKEFSSLSILASIIGDSKLLFDVAGECFDPPPKVTSSVLKIVKTKDYSTLFKENEFEEFKKFLKTAFTQPRKTLLKNLQSSYDKIKVKEWLESKNFSLTIRPHQLSTSDYHLLFKIIG